MNYTEIKQLEKALKISNHKITKSQDIIPGSR